MQALRARAGEPDRPGALPIGPVRVEYGWPIDPRVVPFNVTLVDDKGNVVGVLASATRQEKGRFFFSIGYPF